MTGGPGGSRWVILLETADARRLEEAAAMAASAASLGEEVTVVWLSNAAEALLSGRLADQSQGPRSAARLFAEARETGRVRFLACSAAIGRSGVSAPGLRENVDEIVGWPTLVSVIRAAERAFVW